MSKNDAEFMSCLQRRYPDNDFDDTTLQDIYRGWWLAKEYLKPKISKLERDYDAIKALWIHGKK